METTTAILKYTQLNTVAMIMILLLNICVVLSLARERGPGVGPSIERGKPDRNTVTATPVGDFPFWKRIYEMEAGETAFTVPWAYTPTTRKLNTSFWAHDEPKGTAQMMVKCRGKDQFDVQLLPNSHYSY